MQLLACNFWPLQYHHVICFSKNPFLGRRQLCSDTFSSACSPSQRHRFDSPIDSLSLHSISTTQTQSAENPTKDLGQLLTKITPFTTRRALFSALFLYSFFHPSRYLPAQALGDPSVTIEEVTPTVSPSPALFPTE
ncbi:protease Do-like 8, chloroplastic, partial [Morus notabilis]|uniref:protease Do-like 8, chloroplastic n=1 Tax=Morus notabilis TaxID=981085 RepID=UPI000CED42A6